MIGLLKELLVFILEALRDTPNDNESTATNTFNKKLLAIIAIFFILLAGIGSLWLEKELSSKDDVYKLREQQSQKTIAELQRVNSALKEDRIRLTAETKNLAEMLRFEKEKTAKLEVSLAASEDALEDQRLLSENRLELIRGLQRNLDSAEAELDEYNRETRRIWDEVLTLGNEDRG